MISNAEDEKNFGPAARKLARKALKRFFSNKADHMDACGCDEFNLSSPACIECMVQQVNSMVSDMVQLEMTTPDSKFQAPVTTKDREQFQEAAIDFIQRTLKRTFNSAFSSRKSKEARITDPSEAYEAGVSAAKDIISEVLRGASPEDTREVLAEQVTRQLAEHLPEVHSMIQEYLDRGIQDATDKYLVVRPAPITPENQMTFPREYRVARYEKAH